MFLTIVAVGEKAQKYDPRAPDPKVNEECFFF